MTRSCLISLLTLIILTGCRGEEKSAPSQTQPQEPALGLKNKPETQGTQQSQPLSPETTESNHPPQIISVDVDPLSPKLGDTLRIDARASDPDGDTLKLIYEWQKNNETLSESDSSLRLSGNYFKRGDKITLRVFPDDGLDKGSPGIMTVVIGNSPPSILSSPSDNLYVNRVFTYQVKATDKDNDNLTYSLKAAPTGMTIHSATGLVQWNVPQEFEGNASITVSASDNHGGESVQSFSFEIAPKK